MNRCRTGHFLVIALSLILVACVPPDPAAGQPSRATIQTAQAPAPAPAKPRGWLGADIREIELLPNQSPTGQTGALRVEFAIDDSPAQVAGLRGGDIILSMDGTSIVSVANLFQVETNRGPGATVPIVILRDGQQRTLTAQLAAIPPDEDTRRRRYVETHINSERQAADAAERAGDRAHAFDHLVRALRLSFSSADAVNGPALYNQLLARTAALLPKLRAKPVVPSEADRHNRRAVAILQSATSDEDDDRAAGEFGLAIYEAPWVPDLYLNQGLALDKAGSTESALQELRRYLVANPAARDSGQVTQKIAALEVLAEERRPWTPFTGIVHGADNLSFNVGLRGRRLQIKVLTPAANGSFAYRAGDIVLDATIHDRQFQGKWLYGPPTATRSDEIKCFGSTYHVDSEGEIDRSGTRVQIRIMAFDFNPTTCEKIKSYWTVAWTLAGRPPATTAAR